MGRRTRQRNNFTKKQHLFPKCQTLRVVLSNTSGLGKKQGERGRKSSRKTKVSVLALSNPFCRQSDFEDWTLCRSIAFQARNPIPQPTRIKGV